MDGQPGIETLLERVEEAGRDNDYGSDEFYAEAVTMLESAGYKVNCNAVLKLPGCEEGAEGCYHEIVSRIHRNDEEYSVRFILEDRREGYEAPSVSLLNGSDEF